MNIVGFVLGEYFQKYHVTSETDLILITMRYRKSIQS